MSELNSKGSTKSTLQRRKQCDSLRINASRGKKKGSMLKSKSRSAWLRSKRRTKESKWSARLSKKQSLMQRRRAGKLNAPKWNEFKLKKRLKRRQRLSDSRLKDWPKKKLSVLKLNDWSLRDKKQ